MGISYAKLHINLFSNPNADMSDVILKLAADNDMKMEVPHAIGTLVYAKGIWKLAQGTPKRVLMALI